MIKRKCHGDNMDISKILQAQTNALITMSKSSMPQDAQDEVIENLSKLMGLTLNMTQSHFNLTDDEAMSLLTLIVMKIMEVVDND